jgi:DNA repair exonuclease SbcCD ATPase subunit
MSSSTSSRYRESAAVTAPTKVHEQNSTSFAEEHALDAIAKEAELRLQHQREQNREARQLRHKELEKNARDDDAGDSTSAGHTPVTPIGSSRSRIISVDGINTNAMGTNSSLLQKFLNGDVDLRSIEQRDLRRLLSELETKYKAAMIANSSMYNEKQALRYQVDTFKDILDEHYETLNQAKRQVKEKTRDFDLQKRAFNELKQEHNQLKEILASREKLIQESGMQLLTGDETNGINSEEKPSSVLPTGLVSQETLTLLNSLGKGSIDEKLKRILNEKREQFEQIVKLKSELDEEKNRLRTLEKQIPKFNETPNVISSNDSEQQKQLSKEITDLRSRLQRLEADNSSLQQENKRYDAQLKRHKQQTDDAERIEEDLKQERRRLQRELRAVREEVENERTRNDVLQRENERLRALRKKGLLNTEDSLVVSAIASRSHTNSPLPPAISSSSSSSISTTNDLQLSPSIQNPT